MAIMPQPVKDRHGTYCIVKKLPKELQKATGKWQIKRSLRTKDLAEAKRRYPDALGKILEEIDLIRRAQAGGDELTSYDQQAICSTWLKHKLADIERDDNELIKWFTQSVGEKAGTGFNEAHAYDYWADIREDDEARLEVVGTELNALLLHRKISAPYGSMLHRSLSRELLDQFIELQKYAEKRLQRDWKSQPEVLEPTIPIAAATPARVNGKPTKLSKLFEDWSESAKQEAGKTKAAEGRVLDYQPSMNRLIAYVGDIEPNKVTRSDVAGLRQILYKLPSRPPKKVLQWSLEKQIQHAEKEGCATLSNNTVRNVIVHLRAIFEWAKKSGFVDENVAAGVEPKRTRKRRVVEELNYYTEDDLKAIFSLPVFTSQWLPQHDEKDTFGEAPFWVPLLCYYTGARVEEICQLNVSSVRQESSGIHYLRIEEESPDHSVKEGASARDVPIHKDLLALGLLEYAKSLNPAGKLFPVLRESSEKSKYSKNYSKWWGKYIRKETGNPFEGRKPSHAFRHTFETNARKAVLREDISNYITGRSNGHSGEVYGGWLEACQEALNKIPSLGVLNKISSKWRG